MPMKTDVRKICRFYTDLQHNPWEPDQTAPDISEIIMALEMAEMDADKVRMFEKHRGNSVDSAAAAQRRDKAQALLIKLKNDD